MLRYQSGDFHNIALWYENLVSSDYNTYVVTAPIVSIGSTAASVGGRSTDCPRVHALTTCRCRDSGSREYVH